MKLSKVFIKSFEAPQRSKKIKIFVNFLSSSAIGTGRVKTRWRMEKVKCFQYPIFDMDKLSKWGTRYTCYTCFSLKCFNHKRWEKIICSSFIHLFLSDVSSKKYSIRQLQRPHWLIRYSQMIANALEEKCYTYCASWLLICCFLLVMKR